MSSKALSQLSTFSAGVNAFDLSDAACSEVRAGELARPPSAPDGLGANQSVIVLQDRLALNASAYVEGGPLGGRLKRIIDIFVATTTLLLLSPLMLVVVVLIYVTMGRPIFYAQQRLGFGGKPIPCFKFRTMVNNSGAVLLVHLKYNPGAADEWRQRQKLTNDPRVTELGRLLRRSSIDELPQLFGVLQGHMSCVGPRPVIDQERERYGNYWREYVRARPGMTGAWQVGGRNRLSYETRVSLDRWYVRKWSVWVDLMILAKTIPAVLRMDDTA